MRAYVKLPPNSGHLSITDNFFKSRRCPLFRAFAVPEILNFSGKQWQRNNFFRPIGVLTSLSVIIFSVTLRDRGQIFLKKAAIHENDMIQFFFCFLYTDQMWRKKRMWHEKIPIFCDVTVQVKHVTGQVFVDV